MAKEAPCQNGAFCPTTGTATKCTKCADNCVTCTGTEAAKCTKCAEGFIKSTSTGVCSKCVDANCSECSPAATCTDCKEGFFVKANKCEACTANCLECNNEQANKCTACAPGYIKDTVGDIAGTCEVNPFCKSNCAGCVSGGKVDKPANCVICKDGYTFANGKTTMLGGGECKACTEGCTTCTFAVNSCTACGQEYESDGAACVKKGLSPGAIAGIVIGVIAVLAIAGALIWYFMFYQKGSAVSSIEVGVP